MFRVCCFASVLSIAACISSPEVTLVDETADARDGTVSPDGSAQGIALVEDVGIDGGVADAKATDGGVPPHPERDAGSGSSRNDHDGKDDDEEDDDDEDAGDDGPGKGKGKGKPPKKP